MTILVTGGTGHLGRKVVELLVRDGHRVRVLARTPGTEKSVQWVRGDLATASGHRGMTTWAEWLARDEVAPAARIAA